MKLNNHSCEYFIEGVIRHTVRLWPNTVYTYSLNNEYFLTWINEWIESAVFMWRHVTTFTPQLAMGSSNELVNNEITLRENASKTSFKCENYYNKSMIKWIGVFTSSLSVNYIIPCYLNIFTWRKWWTQLHNSEVNNKVTP